jgi:hypothetical protein
MQKLKKGTRKVVFKHERAFPVLLGNTYYRQWLVCRRRILLNATNLNIWKQQEKNLIIEKTNLGTFWRLVQICGHPLYFPKRLRSGYL